MGAARSLADVFTGARRPWLADGLEWRSGRDILQLAARYRIPALRSALVLIPVATAVQALAAAVAVEGAGGVPVLWPARVATPPYVAALPRVDHYQSTLVGRPGLRWSGPGPAFGACSGGSSGAGKIVLLEVARAIRNAAAVADRVSTESALRVVSLRNPAFSAGLVCDVMGSLLAGDQVAVIPVWSARLGLRAVRQLRPNAVHAAPTIVDEVLDLLPPVRQFVLSGEPLAVTVLDRLRDRHPGAVIMNGYGLSEAGPRVSVGPAHTYEDDIGCGAPLPGVVVRPGDGGTLVVTTPYGCLAVLDGRGTTWSGPSIATGDIGRIAPDGTVVVLGRADDVVSVGGHQVNVAVVAADLQQLVPSAEVSVNFNDSSIVVGIAVRSDQEAAELRGQLTARLHASWPMLSRIRWSHVAEKPPGIRITEAGKRTGQRPESRD
jgi:acyl-CoA synthetase (AMP-forming)/AMP-acid ligase II